MAKTVNIEKFLTLVKKSTANYLIDNIGMKFTNTSYKVGMRGSNVIVILKGDNDIISDIASGDSWELNFSDPVKNVKNYFELIMGDDVPIDIKNDKITLTSGTQKTNIFFVSDNVITGFDGEGPKVEGETLFEKVIDDEFVSTFSLIKKIASSFGKVYFSQDKGQFSIEATDKTNSYSNGMKMALGDSKSDESISICTDFKVIYNVLSLVESNFADFTFKVSYIRKSQGGLISFIKNDGSEKYYILSVRENA